MIKKLAFIPKIGYNNKGNVRVLARVGTSPTLDWYKGVKNLSKIEEKVESLIKDKIENIGYELYDVEYVKEGKDYYLRIFIDSPNGIVLNDCEKVNNEITDLLDEADYIKDAYFLEVSSPGIERVLKKDKHLQANIGTEVNVKLFKKDELGKKEYKGILKDFDKEKIVLEIEEKNIEIERKNISQIKTVYNW